MTEVDICLSAKHSIFNCLAECSSYFHSMISVPWVTILSESLAHAMDQISHKYLLIVKRSVVIIA